MRAPADAKSKGDLETRNLTEWRLLRAHEVCMRTTISMHLTACNALAIDIHRG